MRKKPNAISKGKYKLKLNGQNILSTVYIDFKGMFILVKSERVKVKQDYKTKKYYLEG